MIVFMELCKIEHLKMTIYKKLINPCYVLMKTLYKLKLNL
jgi:hypothetical protein